MNNDSVYKLYDSGTILTIVNGGNDLIYTYQLGAAFVTPGKIVVVRGTGADGGKDLTELYDYANNSITLNSVIHEEVRGNIPIRNMRPVGDINGKACIWQRGYYNESVYTDFNTDAKIKIFD